MIAGDWHGNTKHTIKAVEYASENEADLIISVGDFGFKFEPSFVYPLQAALKNAGLELLFIKGNHDDPNVYNSLVRGEIGLGSLTSNILYVPQNIRMNFNGTEFLFLGGASSIDRSWRTPQVDWWPEEVISTSEANKAIEDGYADVMITHDVPSGVDVKAIRNNPMGWPAHAIRETESHRDLLQVVVDEVKPKMLFCGHMHTRESHILKGKDYTTQVEILDCDGTPLHLNTTFLEL